MHSTVRALFIALFVGSILLLAGCIQPAQADRCKSFASPAEHNSCLRYFAVWDQEPYLCYSIPDTALRASCLEDSTNPIESQKLKDAQTNGLTPTAPGSAPAPPSAPAPGANGSAPSANSSAEARIAQCMAATAGSSDACTRQVGIDTLNMTLCGTISAGDFRASCISNVALTAKKPALCNQLIRTADKQICTYYSSG